MQVQPRPDSGELNPGSVSTTLIPVQQPALQQQQQQEEEGPEDVEAKLSALAKTVARLEAEASEHRLRTELLNRAVGVPEPGAGAWAQFRLVVTGQVSAKLARFGPNNGCIIAALVLLCNALFLYVIVSGKVSQCDQRAAVMDPEPAVVDTYKNMFAAGTNTFICASSVDGIQEFTPGDTCMLFPEEWVAKNGVCDVDTGRCAPGTDCTDCPLDPLCEPGRDGRPTETEGTCACAQDDFCCSNWDVSCSLCELGFDTTAEASNFQPETNPAYTDAQTGDYIYDDSFAADGLIRSHLDAIPVPVLREAIALRHVSFRVGSIDPSFTGNDHQGFNFDAGYFVGIRPGTCAARACTGHDAPRVAQLTHNAMAEADQRLWTLGELVLQ